MSLVDDLSARSDKLTLPDISATWTFAVLDTYTVPEPRDIKEGI